MDFYRDFFNLLEPERQREWIAVEQSLGKQRAWKLLFSGELSEDWSAEQLILLQPSPEAEIPLSDFAKQRWPPFPTVWAWLISILFFWLGGPIWVWASWQDVQRKRSRASWEAVRAENEADFRAAQRVREAIWAWRKEIPRANDLLPGVNARRGLVIGEITRHFDQQTVGSINGWLQFSLRGWGSSSATTYDSSGVFGPIHQTTGQSSGVLVGTAIASLELRAVTRADLFTEGFIAVFDERNPESVLETLRVIAPAEPACQELLVEACEGVGKSFGEGSYRHAALRAASDRLQYAFKTDISYVSDRLNAYLRLLSAERPVVDIVGSLVNDHARVGAAVQFSDKPGEWYQLFPLGLFTRLRDLALTADEGDPAPSLTEGEEPR
ncbi:MAG TPA: hypothetical protein VJM51_04020 [Dehalococcoidia bacterium]|nr:hypothetical protein [Dehalococcoidia bacterium]